MKISFQDNPLKPGEQRVVLHTGRRFSYDDFLDHASMSSTLSRSDCIAVLDCAARWLESSAANGREADLGPLGRSRLGMKGKFKAVPERLDAGDVQMTMSWILPNSLKQSVAQAAGGIDKKRVQPDEKKPDVMLALNELCGGEPESKKNTYTPGKILKIVGNRLNYYLTHDDEGVFVTDESGSTRKIEEVATVQPKQIVCLMPNDLHGSLKLEVRRRTKTNNPLLLCGKLSEPLEEADS